MHTFSCAHSPTTLAPLTPLIPLPLPLTRRCERCARDCGEPAWRYLLSLQAQDHTANTWLTAFGDSGDVIMGCKAEEMRALQVGGGRAGRGGGGRGQRVHVGGGRRCRWAGRGPRGRRWRGSTGKLGAGERAGGGGYTSRGSCSGLQVFSFQEGGMYCLLAAVSPSTAHTHTHSLFLTWS
jgi:hypothetical protein